MIEIVEKAKNNDKSAFSEIYSRYKNQVYYFCAKLVSDQTVAKQLCIDSFECAFERIETLESYEQFEVWLKNIAAIKCFNYIHKMKPMLFLQAPVETSEILFEEYEIEAMDKEVSLDETKSAALMDMMFSRLDDAQRMTLMLHYYIGLSIARIAKIMTCTQEMVVGRMESAAASMKKTLNRLDAGGIKIKNVEFRTVLMLSAACATVPNDVDDKIEAYINEHYGEPQPVEEDKSYSFENYVSSLDQKEPGELGTATAKYTEVELPESVVYARPERAVEKPRISIFAKIRKKFFSLSMTQQSVAMLIAVGIIAIIILSVAIPNNKEDAVPKKESETTSSQKIETPKAPEQTVEEQPKISLSVDNNTPETHQVLLYDESPSDGSKNPAVSTASYALPSIVIPNNEEAQNKINGFFAGEKDVILATYTDDWNVQNSRYGYNYVDGWYATTKVTASTGGASRIDDAVISIEMKKEVKNYGYSDETTVLCYNFSTQTGELLTLDDIFGNKVDDYAEFAAKRIVAIVEQKQENGDFTLNTGYSSIISSAVDSDSSWYLTESGIRIIFQDGSLVNYGYGALGVDLSYSEINQYFDADYAIE